MHRLVVSLVSLISLSGAAVVGGYLFLFSAGADVGARLAPADTAIYVNVFLQPSSGQKMNLQQLAARIPGFADEATLDAKIEQIVGNLLAGEGIDYAGQVKPWLGNQVAIAAGPEAFAVEPAIGEVAPDPAEMEPQGGVVIVSVKDRAEAERALDELVEPTGSESHDGVDIVLTDDGAYAFVEEALVASSSVDEVRAVIDVAGGAPALADAPGYRQAFSGLPPDHVASFFVDIAAIGDGAGLATPGTTTSSAVLVIEPTGLRVEGRAPFDAEAADPAAREAFELGRATAELPGWMPADTQAELVLFGLQQSLLAAEATPTDGPDGQSVGDLLATARALATFGLGLDLDDDVLPLFDGETAVALGRLTGEMPGGQLLLRPSDPSRAEELLARITARLEAAGSATDTVDHDGTTITLVDVPELTTVAWAAVDGVGILALSADDVASAIDAHASGDTLAGRAPYEAAFDLAGGRRGGEGWVDVAGLVDALGLADGLDADTRDILQQIESLAYTASSADDAIAFSAVLTVE